jgi:iron complex transport system substrate-binding protein
LVACGARQPAGTVDQVGARVPPGAARRIVPLAPDVTEIAFAVGAGGRVVAVIPAADYPPAVRSLPRVRPDDAEAILALQPDLVLATTAGNDPRIVSRLRQLGTRVCTVDVTSFARLADACRLIGEVTGLTAAGTRLAQEITARAGKLTERAQMLPRRRALYVVWWEPLIVAAPGSFHDDLLHRAGLDDLAPRGGGRYPRVDPEVLLDPRLEVVVATDEADLHAGFRSITATPAGERLRRGDTAVIWLPADAASRPGPRLVEALQALVSAREAIERQGTGRRAPGTGGGGRSS